MSLAARSLTCLAPLLAVALCGLASGDRHESLRIRLVNATGGAIEASSDRGQTWVRLGSVTTPADRTNPASYTAAGWARDSSVAATATNAIHIQIGRHPQTKRPMTISIVPGGQVVGAAVRHRSSAIVTDIVGGYSIFGGGLGPYVNSPAFLQDGDNLRPLPLDYQPREHDVLVIVRQEPVRLPRYILIENRPGGKVEVDDGDGPQPIGLVDRPVSGVGRFEGAMYAWPGRIRANHPGVIDVSTSPYAMIGGFQIIPREHAASPEMSYVRTGHQWMIIGTADPQAPPWPGRPPLFAETILPSYRPDDITGDHPDWVQRVWSRTMVQVRYEDGPWELMPRIAFSERTTCDNAEASGRGRKGLWLIPAPGGGGRLSKEAMDAADNALRGVTQLRIDFPCVPFPLTGSAGIGGA